DDAPESNRAAGCEHRRAVRAGAHVGRDPDRVLQVHRTACVHDGSLAPPLRSHGLACGDHRDPVLDHRCLVRLPRSGTVLRRVDRDMNRPALARAEDFSGRRVLVAGLGVSGRSAAQVATDLGARVTGADCDPRAQERELPAGVDVIAEADADRLADRALATDPDLIVASPGWNPRTPLLARAQAEVISEVELAWRIAPPQVPWLTLTGTNGKTTTVGMLAAILQAHGWHAPAVGNVGTPIAEEVWRARSSGQELDALAVELSSFQLHYTSTVAPMASACLNVHADHLDWHGGLDAYVAD